MAMTKKLIIASEKNTLYTTKRLLEEAIKLKYSTTWINPYEHLLQNSKKINQPGIYLFRTTGVRYDDFDLSCAQHYSLHHFRVSNSLQALSLFRSKDMQSLFFKEHKINSIPTLMYRGTFSPSLEESLQKISPTENYILKMNRGNQGIGVNLIKGLQSLKSILETFHAMKDQRFTIQPYLLHKKEFRIFIIKNEIHGIIERTITKDDFRGNAKRSSGKLIKKIPLSLREQIEHAFTKSRLDYCGIDLIVDEVDKDNFKFLEINPVPGFEQIEKLAGTNIAKELIINLSHYNK